MMTAVIIFLLCALGLFLFKSKEYSDFSIANKSVTFPLLFSSLVATYLGPGFTLGFIGEATTFGLFTILFFSAYGIQTILTGLFIYPKFQSLENVYSLGGFLKNKFGVSVQFISGAISLALMIVFSTIMVAKGGGIIADLFGSTLLQGVLLFTLVVALYSISGGLRASIVSDAGQLIIFGGVFIAIFFLIIGLKPNISNSIDTAINLTSSEFSNRSILSMLALFISCAFGEALVPPYVARALSADSKNTVKRAFVFGGIGFIIWSMLMAFIGLFCMDLSSAIPLASDTDSTLQVFIQEKFSPFWFHALMVALVLVFMSTFDSLLNAGSVIFTSDIVQPTFKRFNIAFSNEHLISKTGIIIFCILCVCFSLFIGNVIQALLYGYSIWTPSMIPVIFYSVLSKTVFKEAALSSMIIGVISSAVLKYIGLELEFVTLYGLLISSCTLIAIHFLRLSFSTKIFNQRNNNSFENIESNPQNKSPNRHKEIFNSALSRTENIVSDNQPKEIEENNIEEKEGYIHFEQVLKEFRENKRRDFSNMFIRLKDNQLIYGGFGDWHLTMGEANFQNERLSGINFANSSLETANFNGSKLKDAIFSKAKLFNTDFKNSNLQNADFNNTYIQFANFERANLINANFSNCELVGVVFERADLSDSTLPMNISKQMNETHCPKLSNAYMNYNTYKNSNWTPKDLGLLLDKGVNFEDLNDFPLNILSELDLPN